MIFHNSWEIINISNVEFFALAKIQFHRRLRDVQNLAKISIVKLQRVKPSTLKNVILTRIFAP